MKKTAFVLTLVGGLLTSMLSSAQSVEHQVAEQVCNCTQTIVENQLSPALKNIVISKLTADSQEEFEKSLAIYINNNQVQAAKEFQVIQSMADPESPYSRCLLKTQLNFPDVDINSTEMQQFIMVELYEMECEFSAALISFGQTVKP
jgi:hypothetical protein